MYALFIVSNDYTLGNRVQYLVRGQVKQNLAYISVCDKVLFCDAFQLSCEIEIRRFVHPVYTEH